MIDLLIVLVVGYFGAKYSWTKTQTFLVSGLLLSALCIVASDGLLLLLWAVALAPFTIAFIIITLIYGLLSVITQAIFKLFIKKEMG